MSQKLVHRPARTSPPARRFRPFTIEGPQPVDPAAAEAGHGNIMTILPMLAAGGSMVVMMTFRQSPFAAVGAIAMMVSVVVGVAMFISNRGKATRQRTILRDTYTRYLERARVRLRDEEIEAQQAARAASPPPAALFDIVRNPARLWERRRYHEDFLRCRIGSGRLPTRDITVHLMETATAMQDEFMVREAEVLQRRFETSPDMPVTVPLDSAGNLSVVGSRGFALQVTRSLLTGAAALQSPEDLRIAVITPRQKRLDWDWLELLPHLDDSSAQHFTGPVKLIAPDAASLVELLDADLQYRSKVAGENTRFGAELTSGPPTLSRLVVVVDGYGADAQDLSFGDSHFSLQARGITAVHLCAERVQEPSEVALRLTEQGPREDGRTGFLLEDRTRDQGNPQRTEGGLDPLDEHTAAGIVSELAPLRLSLDSLEHTGAEAAAARSFLQMLELSPQLDRADVERLWQPRPHADFLRVPLGPDDQGNPVLLDLKEAAQLGMGPHGLCVGATGSGKSEMLRSLVFGLLATHSPDVLAMVLVDFKGGATFAPFEGAPQVTGIITNLSDDLTLIERVYASLNGEILRRQEVLKSAGNIANITDYQLYREEELAQGRHVEPLPHLVVIIDEFGELLTARPDFIDLFLSIGRIGRSIGVHLLLSSQRIEAGKLRGLETYLSYRLGLRTLSESESRTVLDTPDAFHLPPLPGYGYLKVDTTVYTRFKSGYVSGPLEDEVFEDEAPGAVDPAEEVPPVLRAPDYALVLEEARDAAGGASGFGGASQPAPAKRDGPARRTTGPTVMSTMMDTLRTFPRSVTPIWLPPLPPAITLDQAVGEPKNTGDGLRLPAGGDLTVPIGLLDDPARQWQGLWEIDFTAGSGNLLIHGGPQSGKSTTLRTLVSSLALTHSPQQVGIYCIDLLGAGLLPLQQLPHVGGVAIRTNREVITRTVDEVAGMLAHRERIFEQYAIDSLPTMRTMHAAGRLRELPSADIFLVIDGHGQFAEDFEELVPKITTLMTRGGGYGIHVVTTVSRNNEVRSTHQSFFTHRMELRLTDAGESTIDRKLADNVNPEAPGRALTSAKLQAHVALPRIDGQAESGTVTDGLKDLVGQVGAFTTGSAMKVRVLPAVVDASTCPTPEQQGLFPLGLRELDLGTECLDLEHKDRNLIVMGDEETGKTNLLRNVIRRFTATHTDEELFFVVWDPRRVLGDEVPEDYLGGYATNAAVGTQLTNAVLQEIKKRQDPGQDQSVPQRRARMVALIDDYDVLTVGGGQSPLAPLVPYIPMAADLNMNYVLTRRVRGSSRGMYETFFSTLRDNGTSALILSGDKGEGSLINGVKARRLPPGRGQLLVTGRPVMTVQTFFDGAAQ